MPGKGYRVDTDFKLRPDRRKKRAKAALVALASLLSNASCSIAISPNTK